MTFLIIIITITMKQNMKHNIHLYLKRIFIKMKEKVRKILFVAILSTSTLNEMTLKKGKKNPINLNKKGI